MTDIGNWPELIERKGAHNEYVMVPLNEYQMGNLLDTLTQVQNTGDWYCELQDLIGVAMKRGDIEKVSSNRGLTFTRDQVLDRDLMASVKTPAA